MWGITKIKLLTPEKRRKKLEPGRNYHKTKHFSEKLPAILMNKTNVKMNKPVYRHEQEKRG